MFSCVGPRRRATVSGTSTESNSSSHSSLGSSMAFASTAGHRRPWFGANDSSKPRTLSRKWSTGANQQLDTIPERAVGATASIHPTHNGNGRQVQSSNSNNSSSGGIQPYTSTLQAPPPVIYSSISSGHKRMSSAPPGNLMLSSQAIAHPHTGTAAGYPPAHTNGGNLLGSPFGSSNTAPATATATTTSASAVRYTTTRQKRASTISTIDRRMHSLLISDTNHSSMYAAAPGVSNSSQYNEKGLASAPAQPSELPRWGDAPNINMLLMADSKLELRSPYICHSASRSISSKGIGRSSTATHSSATTLWQQPMLQTPTHKNTHSSSNTRSTRSSNEKSYMVPIASEKYEWRSSWDVI